jgi:hypothetical protein
LMGGIRILVIEFFRWAEWQGHLITIAGCGAVACGSLFLFRAF